MSNAHLGGGFLHKVELRPGEFVLKTQSSLSRDHSWAGPLVLTNQRLIRLGLRLPFGIYKQPWVTELQDISSVEHLHKGGEQLVVRQGSDCEWFVPGSFFNLYLWANMPFKSGAREQDIDDWIDAICAAIKQRVS